MISSVEEISNSLIFTVAACGFANALMSFPIVILDGLCGSCIGLGFVRAVFRHAGDVPR